MFTGEEPDPNYDYELAKNIPGLIEELQALKKVLEDEAKILYEAAGDSTPVSNGIESIITQTEELIEKPEKIAPCGSGKTQIGLQLIKSMFMTLMSKCLTRNRHGFLV